MPAIWTGDEVVPEPTPVRKRGARRMKGEPSVRPKCVNCGAPAKRLWEPDDNGERVFLKWAPLYGGLFCTLRCSLEFAVASYRGGYRRRVER